MADIQQDLDKLLTSHEEKLRLYNVYQQTATEHNEKMEMLAELQPITIKEFEEAEALYDSMILNEKTYHIQRDFFNRNRLELIQKLKPVKNIKIRFSYANEKLKKKEEYYVWLKYNAENPDESQLALQKISDTNNEPKLL